MVLWLTGLPAAGKTTLAAVLAERLRAEGEAVTVLDGDEVRRSISADLGFSRADRDENVDRVARIADERSRAGETVIVALVSPYRAARAAARQRLGTRFFEVYVRASLAECRRRDPKGLYARAQAGELEGLTGMSDPYEPPDSPEAVADTDHAGPQECADQVLAALAAVRR